MTDVSARYQALIETGELRADREQAAAVHRLAQLQSELEASPKRGSLLWRTLRGKPNPPRGLYIWGGVGRGKSMLMDLFHENLAIERKRRVHFHAFMLEIDALINAARKAERGDPIAVVALQIAEEARLLAFDEMVVNNTADASIMGRLFTALIVDHDVTIVTTSNRPPGDLYKDGLNRSLFLPFIALVEKELDVIELNGPTDYRMERLGGIPVWYAPLGDAATDQARDAFFRLTDFDPSDADNVPEGELELDGNRTLRVPKSLKGVAVFSFKRLFSEPRGAADFLAIAQNYHSVILVGLPKMNAEQRNEAIRFTKFIDALYENKVKLIVAADCQPEEVYPAGDGSFEFARTVSRLKEMQSEAYLAAGHGQT